MSPTSSDPIQEFFSIGEVCELTGLKPHVLRYWESQFRFLSPAKNRSGNRVYQRREVISSCSSSTFTTRSTPSRRAPESGRASQGRRPEAVARGALAVQALESLEPDSGDDRRHRLPLRRIDAMRLLITNDDEFWRMASSACARQPLGEVTWCARSRAECDESFVDPASSVASDHAWRASLASGRHSH
jgi:hypothetical protein